MTKRRWWLGATALLASCVGGEIGEPPPPDEFGIVSVPFEPTAGALRRLTNGQYASIVRETFGADVVVPKQLEVDDRREGLLAVGASLGSVTLLGATRYEQTALSVAAQAMQLGPAREALVFCVPAGVADDACAGGAIDRLGRRLWRRPLDATEHARLVALARDAATTLGDFHDGLELAIAELLQSPFFLYRSEIGDPDPAVAGDHRFAGYELATRLAFFLWNGAPDDALLDSAAGGVLDTDEGYAAEVDRLLADDRLRAGVRGFFEDMFRLDGLDALRKDPALFPAFSPDVGPAAREETLRVVEHVVLDSDLPYTDLFRTRTTFLDRKLASIYRVPAPSRDGFGRYDFPETSERRGLLGHVAVLALYAKQNATSAVARGQFVRKSLLCGLIPTPPGDVDMTLPDPEEGFPTLRDRVAFHLQNPACAGCHVLMDPIGLGLERFDALGQYRTEENGIPIDPSSEMNGIPFDDAIGLGEAIATNPDTRACLVRTMYRYATGHVETIGETQVLRDLRAELEASDLRVRALMRAVALSAGFRRAAPASTQTIPDSEEP